MSGPEDQPIEGGAAPAPNEPKTKLGAMPVATREGQTIELPATYLLVVTVRDRTGSPILGARVTVQVDDVPQVERTTDATGLVDPPIVVRPMRNVVVSADFPALPKEAEPKPGSLSTTRDERTLAADAIIARAKPIVKGQKPEWPAIGDAAGVVYVTLRPVCRYRLMRHFPWQNPIIRDLAYKKAADGPTDVGQLRSGGTQDPNDTRDRKQRLRDFIRLYQPKIAGAESITDYLREARGEGPVSPDLLELYKKAEDAEELERRVHRIDRRMDWLKYKNAPKGGWGHYVLGDPGAPPEEPIASGDEEEPQETRADDLPPAKDDKGASETDKDVPQPADPKKKRIAQKPVDVSSDFQEHKSLRLRRQALLKAAASSGIAGDAVVLAESLELSHRELLEYIQKHIFEKDPDRVIVPGWVRYAVLHFSGLRYASSHFSYYPTEEILAAIREDEIAAGTAEPTADPQRLAILLEEHAALLGDDGALLLGLQSKAELHAAEVAAKKNKPAPAPLALSRIEDALETLRGGAPTTSAAPPKKKKAPVDPEEVLVSTVRACADYWLRTMNSVDLREQAFSAARPPRVSPPEPPLEEAWGLLVRYRDTSRIPAEAWPGIVQYTELRNDFVNVPAVAFPKPKKQKKGDPPPAPFVPPPPVTPSKWPVMVPSMEGRADKEYPGIALIGRSRMDAWKRQQVGDLSLVVSRAVCNQITEMVAAARGVQLKGGITGDSGDRMLMVEDDDQDADAPGFAQRSLLDVRQIVGLSGALYYAGSPTQIQRGDLMFFMTWRQIGDVADTSAWVSPFLPVPMIRMTAYHPLDALPVPPPPPPKKGEPKPPPPPVPGTPAVLHATRNGPGASFAADGRPIRVLTSDAEVLRGSGARPDALYLNQPGVVNAGARHEGVDQIALLPTGLAAKTKLDYVFVRRHPAANKYSEVLGWMHIATVIDPPAPNGQLITFETYAPTGVNTRPWSPSWAVIYGRPVGQSDGVPYLDHYLDPAKLLDEVALPKTKEEDR